MIRGVNIDITNNPPDPDLLVRLGCAAVRFPSREGTDDYIARLHQRRIFSLCVVDQPSAGYIAGGGECSAYQVNNEVDIRGISAEEYRDELRIYRETYPGLVLVAAGLAAGDYAAAYLKAIVGALRDYRISAVALHPYNKSPSAATQLLTMHRKVDRALPVMYSECHPEAESLRAFHKSAADAGCAAIFYHCFNDNMTLASEGIRFGLVDENGGHKTELGYWLFA